MRQSLSELERSIEVLHQHVLEKAEELRVRSDIKKKKNREFKEPENDNDIENYGKKQFAEKSKQKILWAVNLYDQWRKNRMRNPGCCVEIYNANLQFYRNFSKVDLCFALSRFVREVKKINGNDYPPNTPRELVIMVQMYLHQNGVFWKLLDDSMFASLRNVLDNTMKERHKAGLGVRRSSEIITLETEDKLFKEMGEQNPLQLLRKVIYTCKPCIVH